MNGSPRRALTVLFGLLSLGSCNTSPASADLLGKWGGQDINVLVGSSQVEFDFSCNGALAPEPIVVDGDRHFTLVASLYRAGSPTVPDTIAGILVADTMKLDFSVAPDPDRGAQLHYTARIGVPSNLDGVIARACP